MYVGMVICEFSSLDLAIFCVHTAVCRSRFVAQNRPLVVGRMGIHSSSLMLLPSLTLGSVSADGDVLVSCIRSRFRPSMTSLAAVVDLALCCS